MNRTAEAVTDWLVEQMAERLAVEPAKIDLREPLASYDLSSTEAVVLSGDLEEWLERELPATLVWDYPTIDLLARLLGQEDALATAVPGEGA